MYSQAPKKIENMQIKEVVKWNVRVSMLYAFGIWTMLGTYGYYQYMGRNEEKPVKEEKEEQPPNPREVTIQSAHMKTTIVYKENFVPYSTRIYNFVSCSVETLHRLTVKTIQSNGEKVKIELMPLPA